MAEKPKKLSSFEIAVQRRVNNALMDCNARWMSAIAQTREEGHRALVDASAAYDRGLAQHKANAAALDAQRSNTAKARYEKLLSGVVEFYGDGRRSADAFIASMRRVAENFVAPVIYNPVSDEEEQRQIGAVYFNALIAAFAADVAATGAAPLTRVQVHELLSAVRCFNYHFTALTAEICPRPDFLVPFPFSLEHFDKYPEAPPEAA